MLYRSTLYLVNSISLAGNLGLVPCCDHDAEIEGTSQENIKLFPLQVGDVFEMGKEEYYVVSIGQVAIDDYKVCVLKKNDHFNMWYSNFYDLFKFC